MHASGLPDGTPILCRNCAGAMTLRADLSAECQHCGSVDDLPRDDVDRVLEIKRRLALARERALQVQGVDAALATIFEDRMAFVRVSGVYLVVALAVVVMSVSQCSSPSGLSPVDSAELLLERASAPVMMLGIGLSFAIALGYGRRHYQKTLRPLLLARVPAVPGARARCRVCGGALPEARSIDVRCEYCGSLNLVPRELHSAQAHALEAEAEALRAQLAGVNVATVSIAGRMRSALLVVILLSIATGVVLPMLGR